MSKENAERAERVMLGLIVMLLFLWAGIQLTPV